MWWLWLYACAPAPTPVQAAWEAHWRAEASVTAAESCEATQGEPTEVPAPELLIELVMDLEERPTAVGVWGCTGSDTCGQPYVWSGFIEEATPQRLVAKEWRSDFFPLSDSGTCVVSWTGLVASQEDGAGQLQLTHYSGESPGSVQQDCDDLLDRVMGKACDEVTTIDVVRID